MIRLGLSKRNLCMGVLLVVLFNIAAMGQKPVVFHEESTASYVVASGQELATRKVPQHILSDLAVGGNKPLAHTEFICSYNQYIRLTKLNAYKYELYAYISDFKVSGDKTYRAFDMTPCLLPNQLNIDLKVISHKNRRVNHAYEVRDLGLDNGRFNIIKATFVDSTGLPRVKVRMENKDFVYDKVNLQVFDEKVGAIDQYYQAMDDLGKANVELRHIDPFDIDQVYPNETRLNAISQLLADLRNAHFIKVIDLSYHDPAGYLALYDQVHHLTNEKRGVLSQTLAKLDFLFFERAMDCLAHGDHSCARNYIDKSIKVNPNFAPAHYELALMDFNQGHRNQASKRLVDIVNSMNPDPQTHRNTSQLLATIYDQLVTEGWGRLVGKDNKGALDKFAAAERLCQSTSALNCLGKMYDGMARAKQNIYEEYLELSRQYMAEEDLKGAERYAVMARDYKNSNKAVVDPDNKADILYLEAKRLTYEKVIRVGRRHLEAEKFRDALNKFDQARELESSHNFNRHPDLDRLTKAAAKPVIMRQIRKGREYVKKNDLKAARRIVKETDRMRNSYGLTGDEEINSSFNGLRDRIFEQKCRNADNQYKDLLMDAKAKITANEFIEADRIYGEAIRVIRDNSTCNLSDQIAQEGKNEITQAVQFQKQMITVGEYIRTGRNDLAVKAYLEASEFYHKSNVRRYHIEHKDLFDFIRDSYYQDFVAYGAWYYVHKDQYDRSLVLLRKLLANQYPRYRLKQTMVKLGQRLAVADHRSDPGADPKVKVVTYTKGDKSMKKLKKAYVKQWKKLK